MPNNSSTLTRRFAELAHIAAVLPAYATRFTAPAYSWLTVDYLAQSTRPAQEFFAAATQLDSEVLALSTETLATKAVVLQLGRGARLVLQASALFAFTPTPANLPSAQNLDLISQTQQLVLLLGSQTQSEHSVSACLDLGKLKTELTSALTAFMNAKSALEGKKLTLSNEQKQYVVYEDAIDDLWHTVTNALDGLFHEEWEVLYTFMPWRKKAMSTATPPADVPPAA